VADEIFEVEVPSTDPLLYTCFLNDEKILLQYVTQFTEFPPEPDTELSALRYSVKIDLPVEYLLDNCLLFCATTRLCDNK
jgi:hypothetical protein